MNIACTSTTQCETLLAELYQNSTTPIPASAISTDRVNCYTYENNDASTTTATAAATGRCACRVDYGWTGLLCDTPSASSKASAAFYFAIFGAFVIVGVYRGRPLIMAWNSRLLTRWDARGYTLRWAFLANFILAPLAALGYGLYYFFGPAGGASEALRLWQQFADQLFLAVALLALLSLTLAFVEISTAMRQLRGFQKARVPLIGLALVFFASQITLLFLNLGNEAIYITLGMMIILLILVLVGPGWMFAKLAGSLKREREQSRLSRRGIESDKTDISDEHKWFSFKGTMICLSVLMDEIVLDCCRGITRNVETDTGTGNGEEPSSNNSRNSKAGDKIGTPSSHEIAPTPSITIKGLLSNSVQNASAGGYFSKNNDRERIGSKDSKESVEISMLAIRDRADSKESASSHGSKNSKSPLNDEPDAGVYKVQKANGSNGLIKTDSKSSVISQPIDGVGADDKPKKHEPWKIPIVKRSNQEKQQRSDRNVARFLSRVLQLSIRIGVYLFFFIASALVGTVYGNILPIASLNNGMMSLVTVTRAIQLVAVFLIVDSIFWFFSEVLRKELEKKKRRASHQTAANGGAGRNIIFINREQGGEQENTNEIETDARSKHNESKADMSKASSVIVMNGQNITGASKPDENHGAMSDIEVDEHVEETGE